MTISRSKLVNPEVTRWYHCISKCVRNAFLLSHGAGDSDEDRKAWIENRLRLLNKIFAVSVAGFAILDNHLHTLIRIDNSESNNWSPHEVARRWFLLFPPKDKKRKRIEVTSEFIELTIQDTVWVEKIRGRLTSISWFMKCLKEPLARMANKFDGCSGTFFQGRFKSIAILDDEALIAVCAYIDLNPVAAGISETPEESDHTSIKERMRHVASQNRIHDLKKIKQGSVASIKAASMLEDDLWLVPIEDRRSIDSKREGMFSGFTLGNYLMLVEYTGRSFRNGKTSISPELADVFDRLGTSSAHWLNRLTKMNQTRWLGSCIASNQKFLLEAAAKLGRKRLANVVC